jgi:hypothetical protein
MESTRIVAFIDDSRALEGATVLAKHGCNVRILLKGQKPLFTDILLLTLPEESRKRNPSTCVRLASYRVRWDHPEILVPNRIGLYDNGADLEIPLLDAVVQIEKWRDEGCQGLPWGGSSPETERNQQLLTEWQDQVRCLQMHLRTWSNTPDLPKALAHLQRRRNFIGKDCHTTALRSVHGWMNE